MHVAPQDTENETTLKFATAEEAWFWFIRCDAAREEGASSRDRTLHAARPCEPADIYRWLNALYKKGVLLPSHGYVLGYYGTLDRQPFADVEDEILDWIIWIDAFDYIDVVLREKGVIE